MRFPWVLSLVCLVGATALATEPAPNFSSITVNPGATFPAVLKTKLDASKVKAGDLIKMELMTAVPASGVTSIPQGAKIYGKIIAASKLGDSGESRLMLQIDRLEWKHTVVPLHAVISGFGAFKMVLRDGITPLCSDSQRRPSVSAPVQEGATQRHGTATATMLAQARKECQADENARNVSSSSTTRDIAIRRLKQRPDVTVLISNKKDVVLKSGTLLSIRNIEDAESARSEPLKH